MATSEAIPEPPFYNSGILPDSLVRLPA